MKKQQIYPCLRKLQNKGIVTCTSGNPALFSAMPIEEALNFFIKENLDEAQHMEKNKEKILSFWHSIMKSRDST